MPHSKTEQQAEAPSIYSTVGRCAAGSRRERDVALLYSLGVDVPYAIGLLTERAVEGAATGAGVAVLHCYNDELWKEYEAMYVASCRAGAPPHDIPPSFGNNVVIATDGSRAMYGATRYGHTVGNAAPVMGQAESGESKERHVDVADVMPDAPPDAAAAAAGEGAQQTHDADAATDEVDVPDDDILQFALCEMLKRVTPSMLPMPLAIFTSMFLDNYPRGVIRGENMTFKHTRYKTALCYFLQHIDVLALRETAPGVYEVTRIARSAAMMNEHAAKHAKWIAALPRDGSQSNGAGAPGMFGESIELHKRVTSTAQLYNLTKNLTGELAYALLLGVYPAANERLQGDADKVRDNLNS